MRTFLMSCAVGAALTAVVAAPADAASLRVSPSTGAVTYAAKPGEVNGPRFNAPGTVDTGRTALFLGDVAPVTLGAGCTAGTPIVCGDHDSGTTIDISLGDRDDTAQFSSFVGSVTADGGPGDDKIHGDAMAVTLYGRAGDDVLAGNGDFDIYAYGGAGDDRISTFGFNHEFGDAGDDLIAAQGFGSGGEAHGGVGADRIVMTGPGGGTHFFGEGGDDLLVIAPTGWGTPMDGGAGDDIISGAYGRNRVDGGAGHDLIDVIDRGDEGIRPEGEPDDTVVCGPGRDVVWADADDEVAADCEVVMGAPGPTFPGVAKAISDATTMS